MSETPHGGDGRGGETYDCRLCGESFNSMGSRAMHVQRGKCPEVDSESDKLAGDLANIASDLFGE